MKQKMTLKAYIQSLPINERMPFRELLATAHGKTVALVRKWENYPPPADWDKKKVASMSRRHTATAEAFKITEELTNGMVTRHSLRPDIFEEINKQ